MAERRIYIDKAPGETRGVVTLDGRPERLLIEREGEAWPRLGLRRRARVALVDRALGLAVLDLGEGQEASLRLKADRAPPTQGQSLDIEIAIEPQGGKPAVARALPPDVEAAEGLPLEQRLDVLAPGIDTCRHRSATGEPVTERWEFAGYELLEAQMWRDLAEFGWWFDTAALTRRTRPLVW